MFQAPCKTLPRSASAYPHQINALHQCCTPTHAMPSHSRSSRAPVHSESKIDYSGGSSPSDLVQFPKKDRSPDYNATTANSETVNTPVEHHRVTTENHHQNQPPPESGAGSSSSLLAVHTHESHSPKCPLALACNISPVEPSNPALLSRVYSPVVFPAVSPAVSPAFLRARARIPPT